MGAVVDQPAREVFRFLEYLLMPKPTGKKATNLAELLQSLQEMTEPVLVYHLWQSRLALTHTLVEYPNDFALWAARALHDDRLAEMLSALDPFEYDNLTQIRKALVDLLEGYVREVPHQPQVRPGFELYFCEAAAVVMHSGITARTLREFAAGLQSVGLDSIYYHFVEARWRPAGGRQDDFSHWIGNNFALPPLVAAIRDIDVSFYTLAEIRRALLVLLKEHANVGQPAA